MFWKAKYIICEGDTPVVFPEILQHADVARNLFGQRKISGAGFVYVNSQGSYSCYGESVSLKVKSRNEEDSKILNKYLGGPQEDI